MAKKSLLVTYLLWLIGGFFGLHHFYLGRDRHGFLYCMLLGGYFGIGWIRDLWRIPTYVKDANEDPQYMEELASKMRSHERPPRTFVRSTVQLLVADGLGYLTLSALPTEYIPDNYMPIAAVLVPFAVATGVHLVGNIGRERGDFRYILCAAYLTYPLYFWNLNSVFWTSLLSIAAFNRYAVEWRRSPPKSKPLYQRILVLTLCGLLYFSLWSSYFYFNCTIVSKDGEEVKCRDAAKHFFRSPIWQEFLTVMQDLWLYTKYHGWREVWHHIVEAFDPQGHASALKVLGLEKTATEQEITARYRSLSRKWHPDKHHDPIEKERAQEKFIELQQAYEILSQIKSHRVAQNAKVCESDSCE